MGRTPVVWTFFLILLGTFATGSVFASAAHPAVHLSSGLSTNRTYAGEQVIYSIRLHHKKRVSDISIHVPETRYLTVKKLGVKSIAPAVPDDRGYQTVELRYAVMGSRPGEYSIGPAEIDLSAYLSPDSTPSLLSNGHFFSSPEKKKMHFSTRKASLSVIPLPQKGKPKNFSGLVGSFVIRSRLKPAEITVGEPVVLTVTIAGRGNVYQIPEQVMPRLKHMQAFHAAPVLKIEPGDKGLQGTRKFESVLIPVDPGIYEIPTLSVNYFDPAKGKYRTARSTSRRFTVFPSANKKHGTVSRKQVRGNTLSPLAPEHQRPEETGREPSSETADSPKSLTFWLLLLGLPVLIGLTLASLRYRNKTANENLISKSNRSAMPLFQPSGTKVMEPSEQLLLTIRDYFNQRFSPFHGTLTSVDAKGILLSNGVSREGAEQFRIFLFDLEKTVYSGGSGNPFTRKEDLEKLIQRIEREAEK